ncbi:MAG: hypothetical protein ACLPID_15550 [Beijerinckiaceae bacterium]
MGLPHRETTLDHDDFGLNQSKIMKVIDSHKLERDRQISLRNLRKLDCTGKAAQRPTFPHPALLPLWVEAVGKLRSCLKFGALGMIFAD